jgi:hypothetical protein
MRCVITGCVLSIDAHRAVVGDLFDCGDSYVFNANWREPDGICWIKSWQATLSHGRQLSPIDWWEKRGVFIIPKDRAGLNDACIKHMFGAGAATEKARGET